MIDNRPETVPLNLSGQNSTLTCSSTEQESEHSMVSSAKYGTTGDLQTNTADGYLSSCENDCYEASNLDLISSLFERNKEDLQRNCYPKTFPLLPPERRGKRHRSSYFRRLNNFRHWWKTSRLLVRIAGGLSFMFLILDWDGILPLLENHKHRGLKAAVKGMKKIGQGGMSRAFLKQVQPFTRTLRLYMATMRGFEANVDNRAYDVLAAEAMAFMGNRSIRWWARKTIDWTSKVYIFPLLMKIVKGDNCALCWRVAIGMTGLLRAVLPFASSFVGSRIGRQTTFVAINRFNFRWKVVQFVKDFVISAGTYRATSEDSTIIKLATDVASAIGHGDNPLLVRKNLNDLRYDLVGSGAGGYMVYSSNVVLGQNIRLSLHVSPYGPSILDEMPRFIILEARETSSKLTLLHHIEGFTYSGCFFTSQEWAALKERHDREISCYDAACKYMGYKSNLLFTLKSFVPPPTDLASLKSFIRTGRYPRKKKRDNRRWLEVTKQVDQLSRSLIDMDRRGTAPTGVIIYMEGLDCAGKSSTGGLIMDALDKAGYDISQAQYNRPPTSEDLRHPWMWRFKKPNIRSRKTALIWDRGPAGDFVYGDLDDLTESEKCQYYASFQSFDKECRSQGILFCKFLFVTDRDSLSSTLGKRLAHKRIVRDLHAWLDANSSRQERSGLEEIENHIDTTDFIALNKFNYNLHKFVDFALRTDHIGRKSARHYSKSSCDFFPWLIVNTSQRHQARIQIMKSFQQQLEQYENSENGRKHMTNPTRNSINYHEIETFDDTQHDMFEDCSENPGNTFIAWKESLPYLLVLIAIPLSYLHQTWNVSFWGDEEFA